ncbi:MAG: hypothetical protein ACKVT1_05465 [Dehalococcoidia bacterium]
MSADDPKITAGQAEAAGRELDALHEALAAAIDANGLEPHPGSPAAADVRTYGPQAAGAVFTVAFDLAAHAADHASAIRQLLVEPAHPRAAHTVARALYEGDGLSRWLLSPEDGRARLEKVFTLQIHDLREELKVALDSKSTLDPEEYRVRLRQVGADANQARLGLKNAKDGLPAYCGTPFPQSSDLPTDDVLPLWRFMSGIAHARPWAARTLSSFSPPNTTSATTAYFLCLMAAHCLAACVWRLAVYGGWEATLRPLLEDHLGLPGMAPEAAFWRTPRSS